MSNFSDKEKDKKRKKARERYQNYTKEEKKRGVSITRDVSRSYLSKEKIIIPYIVSDLFSCFEEALYEVEASGMQLSFNIF